MRRFLMAIAALVVAATLSTATSAFAQLGGGTLSGTLTDEQGGVLPGVTVTISGSDRTTDAVSDEAGKFRFLNLAPGQYKVSLALQGFATTIRENVVVAVGVTTDLPAQLKVAAVAETVTVSGESPVIDTKATGTTTNFTSDELAENPDVARSVCADAQCAGRARRSRQHRRQRDRPAVELRLEGHAAAGCELDAGRRRGHGHGGHRRVADVLQLRQLRRDPGLDRRTTTSRRRTGGIGLNMVVKRGTNQYPRQRPRLLRQRVDGIVQRAGRAEGDGRHARDVRSQQADLRLRRRARRTDLPRQGLVLRLLFDPGRAARAARRRARRSHPAQEPEREGQLAGDEEGQRQLPVSSTGSRSRTAAARASAGITVRRADRDLPPGQRLHRLAVSRPLEGCRRSRVRHEHVRRRRSTRSTTPGSSSIRRAACRCRPGRDFVHATSYGSINQSINIRPQHTATVDVQSFFNGFGGSHDLKYGIGWRRVEAASGTLWPGNMILAIETREQPAGAGVPPGLRRQPRPVCRFLRGRYALAQPLDARSRPAVRSSGRRGASERDAAERGVPDRRSRRRVRGLQDAVHVERLVAAGRLHLRARQLTTHGGPGELHRVRRGSSIPEPSASEIQAPRQVRRRIAGSI